MFVQDERTPLHRAADNGHEKACEALLAGGADVNARDRNQFAPLHFAACEGHEKACEGPHAHGADLHARDP